MPHFDTNIGERQNGKLVPYDSLTIESDSLPDALERAKVWVKTLPKIRDNSQVESNVNGRLAFCLKVSVDGEVTAIMKPGEL